jgi:hypothetical protein
MGKYGGILIYYGYVLDANMLSCLYNYIIDNECVTKKKIKILKTFFKYVLENCETDRNEQVYPELTKKDEKILGDYMDDGSVDDACYDIIESVIESKFKLKLHRFDRKKGTTPRFIIAKYPRSKCHKTLNFDMESLSSLNEITHQFDLFQKELNLTDEPYIYAVDWQQF